MAGASGEYVQVDLLEIRRQRLMIPDGQTITTYEYGVSVTP